MSESDGNRNINLIREQKEFIFSVLRKIEILRYLDHVFGSERSLRSADVVGGSVGLWVCPHYALQLF